MSRSRMIVAPTLLVCFITCAASAQTRARYNVRDYGAVGDATAKDTVAFQKALDICAVSGGGDVIVPAGKYLIGSVQMGTQTILRLEQDSVIIGSPDIDDYPMMDIRWEGRWQPGRRALIYASNVDHTGIIGPGRIEGNPGVAAPQNPRGSVVIEPINCNDIHWEGFSVTQGGNWATHPTYCNDVVIKNVNIRGNRDGIDIDSCKNVRIEECDINTGDDSISLKSGRGLNGARIGRPTEDVLITNCTLTGRTFACIGIGSETSAGVRNIRVEHTKMTASSQAIYIKTRIGRAGVNENMTFDDLDISGELGGTFVRINLISGGNTNTADDPVEGLLGYPIARNLKFNNIRLSGVGAVLQATEVTSERPIEGLTLTNITGTSMRGITMMNVKNAVLKDIKVDGVTGPLLATRNVTGTGLEGAVEYTAPAPSTAPAGARRGFAPRGARGTSPAPGR